MRHANNPGVEKKAPLSFDDQYKAKTYTLREQVITGIKMSAVIVLVFLAIWLFEKM